MGKGLLYQQQCYGDNGMWMDTEAQQQSYAFHEESWGTDNNHHNQFPGMQMKPPGAFGMQHELLMPKHHGGQHGMLGGGASRPSYYAHGGGKKHGFGDTHAPHRVFPNGGAKFNQGGSHHNGYYSEESEYEAYSEEHAHHGAGNMNKMDEMRYERHNWGNGDGYYANPYDGRVNRNNMNMNMNMHWKPHGGHKPEWTAKGV